MATQVLHDRVMRHQSELGQWERVCRKPDPRLRGYVYGYEGYAESMMSFRRRLETPSSIVVLIISLDATLRVIDPREPTVSAPCSKVFVAGLYDSYVFVEPCAAWRGLQVNFTPIGAHLFLGLPMQELTNRVVEFDDLLGTMAGDLLARLHEAPNWDARFAILDTAIAARLAVARTPSAGVGWAWCRLNASGGCLSISALAAEIGCSQKHLIAQFHEQIGLSPKMLARILRFHRVTRLLDRDTAIRWAAIAHDCGYYDQAHLIRDFRQFAGSTPSEFLGRRLPDGGGLVGD